jgi:hypothetical protein
LALSVENAQGKSQISSSCEIHASRINKRMREKFGGYREPCDWQIAFLIKNKNMPQLQPSTDRLSCGCNNFGFIILL